MVKPTAIITEITNLTTTIETDYPELYKFLEESPITLSSSNYPEMSDAELVAYLEDLKLLLNRYKNTHNNKII